MPLRSANIIGSGPNGLAAAITLAQRGIAVTVYERNATPGGACTTAELTLPGFLHDVGSSVYPLGIASPFFRTLPLEAHGLRYIHAPAPLAHPLDDGTAALFYSSLQQTAAQFDNHDRRAWLSLLRPLVDHWPMLADAVTHPILRFPHEPFRLAAFGLQAMTPASVLAKLRFRGERSRALFAGNAAHAVLPLTHIGSSGAGLVLSAAAHATGWPIAQGGAQSLTSALVSYLTSLGGKLVLNANIEHLAQLDPTDATLFDTSPQALDRIAGDALTPSFRSSLRRFRNGPGAFKLDWALSAPIPWTSPDVAQAATVHLGGTLEEIAASESAAFNGKSNNKPFVLVVQPSLFDPSRAPAGQHTAWAYCHIPNGSTTDYTEAIESQVQRFAPGFRDCILARSVSSPATLERWNPNLVGGDISGGAMTIPQLIARPTTQLWSTSNPKIFLASASTPPGGGVHGMCGHLAALAALQSLGSPTD